MIHLESRGINRVNEDEYIGMCRREVWMVLRDRAAQLGANLINATVRQLRHSDKQY